MGILGRCLSYIFTSVVVPRDHLDRNIYYLERAIQINEEQISQGCDCGLGCGDDCLYGIVQKVERQKAWLEVLLKRKAEREKLRIHHP